MTYLFDILSLWTNVFLILSSFEPSLDLSIALIFLMSLSTGP